MPIHYEPATNSFFLHAGSSTYAFKVLDFGCACHLYWGKHIAPQRLDHLLPSRGRSFSPNPDGREKEFSLNDVPLECPAYGNSDFRSPAVEVYQPVDGSRIVDFRYVGHSIRPGKPILAGLPATFVDSDAEAETLTVEFVDEKIGVSLELTYTVFSDHPIITRAMRLLNRGKQSVSVRRALSCSVDFSAEFSSYHFIQLSGNWARERGLICSALRPGTQAIESRRGTSSHQHNPFMALTELGDHEEHGSVYGFNLVYSGNFIASVEVNEDGCPRAQIGINPFDFAWHLEPENTFQTPETVLVYSAEGLGGMSRALHRFYRRHLCRSSWQHRSRPVLVNNWEATYFDFTVEKLERIAEAGAELGVELLVLDDGWFGKRNNERSSLGDWFAHAEKLPNGIADLVARINRRGLQFGLWFEPEMVSVDSVLYRAHPDWCLHLPGRSRTQGRCQLVLDFSLAEVREAVFEQMAAIARSVPLAYVKWDMNRHLTETGSAAQPPARQQETAHRVVLGVYEMMDRFMRTFPHILCEGSSGGGGRFDPGMLHYMPQIWTSDNSDAIARLKIQYGTSLAYPLSTMAAHVSVVPNHQVGRVTPFDTRAHVAMTGAFGFELDLSKLNADEKARAREQIRFYKRVWPLLTGGDLYRLRNPFKLNEAAWMVVSEDRSEAFVTHVTVLAEANPPQRLLSLRGLDPDRVYRLEGSGEEFRGDALLHIGLTLPLPAGDFSSCQWHLRDAKSPLSQSETERPLG